jgi:hypothetical protein
MKKKFRSFTDARKFVQKLGLKNNVEWRNARKDGKIPDDIPGSIERVYKKEWKGWGYFLGTKNVHMKKWRSFNDARKFVRSLELMTYDDWANYAKSKNKPEDIPVHPERAYKNEWKNMGDWLGTGKTRDYRLFEDARKFVQSLNLSGQKDWANYAKSKNKPKDIPTAPETVYKNKGWNGMGDWLGTGNIAPINRQYRSFEVARSFAQSLNLKSRKGWEEYSKSGNKPDDIPLIPRRNYKKEWKGWGDWLGTGNISDKLRKYRSFEDAREFVHKLGLKGYDDWVKYCVSGNKPDDIPSNPWNTYKKWKKK